MLLLCHQLRVLCIIPHASLLPFLILLRDNLTVYLSVCWMNKGALGSAWETLESLPPIFVPENETSFEELRVEAMKAIRAHNFGTYVSLTARHPNKIHFDVLWQVAHEAKLIERSASVLVCPVQRNLFVGTQADVTLSRKNYLLRYMSPSCTRNHTLSPL
jgi:hypothetical protein